MEVESFISNFSINVKNGLGIAEEGRISDEKYDNFLLRNIVFLIFLNEYFIACPTNVSTT